MTLGILGGGQLARMLCLDARRMGIETIVWAGTPTAPPTQRVADELILKPFDDVEALAYFCQRADVATVEFENIPSVALEGVDQAIGLHPSPHAIQTAQQRGKEKRFLRQHDIPCAPFEFVDSLADLEKAHQKVGPDAVLKTAAFGYDGKGQVRLSSGSDLAAAWQEVGKQPCVLEGFIDFACEVSVLVARGKSGEKAVFPVAENQHRHHMLDLTIVPARIDQGIRNRAKEIALQLAEALDYRGLLAVEFFITKSGEVLVNELAPRPHNSGHFTMNGCVTSQFEQQLRAVMGLPLGATDRTAPTVMLNLLGDMWRGEPRHLNRDAILQVPNAKLHLYGKTDPGERRKMGHLNVVGEDALAQAQALKSALLQST